MSRHRDNKYNGRHGRDGDDRAGGEPVVQRVPAPGKVTRVDLESGGTGGADVQRMPASGAGPRESAGHWDADEFAEAAGLNEATAPVSIDRPAEESLQETRATIDDSPEARHDRTASPDEVEDSSLATPDRAPATIDRPAEESLVESRATIDDSPSPRAERSRGPAAPSSSPGQRRAAAVTIDRPVEESLIETRATIDGSPGGDGERAGEAEPGWVVRARAYHDRQADRVRQFNELTAGACADGDSVDPVRVARWQQEHGVPPDGRVGPATLRAARALAPDPGAPLPGGARSRLEATAGKSLADVRVRDDGDAQSLAASYDARAVTIGQTIHVGAGEDLASDDGQRLLAHETAHTIQQAQSGAARAAAKPLAATMPTDPAEREADRFADATMFGQTFPIGESLGDVAALDRKGSGQSADELTRDRDGENAYMTVRAYEAQGGLVDLWTGPAFFYGDLPVEYVGTKKNGRWRWSRGGEADPRGAELKVNSDKKGRSGVPVAQWAPDNAVQVIASVRGLMNPFENRVVIDDSGPLTMIGRFAEREADGATSTDPDAPGRLTGPLQPGAIAQSGELLVEQEERATTFRLGHSVLRVTAQKTLADYAFTVEPQTSPRQRVVEIVGVAGVDVDLDNDAESAQLVYHLVTVPPGQVPKPTGSGGGTGAVLPELVVLGDGVRCDFLLDGSRIHVEAVQPGAKFAYWIDPEWSGEHGETRAVHIIATPGVRVDELADPGGGRKLAANPIYVQDPDRVPKQGTPIDPADYLGVESVHYGAGDQDAATVYSGGDSVTIRDHDRGVYVALSVVEPAKGGRFAWTLEQPTDPGAPTAFRVLVGPGVHVHVHELTEPGPLRPPQFEYQDFGVDIDLRHTDDPENVPPQGAALTAEFLAGFDVRQPDSRSYADPLDGFERNLGTIGQMVGDTAIGFVPVVGDAVDLAEAAVGVDKWGNELTVPERIALGVVALLPFVGGAFVKAGRAMRGLMRADSELAAFAAKLGKTEAELEAMLASLRRLDDDALAAARRIDEAVQTGGAVDPADLARLDRGLRQIGLGGLPETTPSGMRTIDDPNAPRVRAPDDVPMEAFDDLRRAEDVVRTPHRETAGANTAVHAERGGDQGAARELDAEEASRARRSEVGTAENMVDVLAKSKALPEQHAHEQGSVPVAMVLRALDESPDLTPAQRHQQIEFLEQWIAKATGGGKRDVAVHDLSPAATAERTRDGQVVDPEKRVIASGDDAARSGILNDLLAAKRDAQTAKQAKNGAKYETAQRNIDAAIREYRQLIPMRKPDDAVYGAGVDAATEFFVKYKMIEAHGLRTPEIAEWRNSASQLGMQELRYSPDHSGEAPIGQIRHDAQHLVANQPADVDVSLTYATTKNRLNDESPAKNEQSLNREFVDTWYSDDTLQRAFSGIDNAGMEHRAKPPAAQWESSAVRAYRNAQVMVDHLAVNLPDATATQALAERVARLRRVSTEEARALVDRYRGAAYDEAIAEVDAAARETRARDQDLRASRAAREAALIAQGVPSKTARAQVEAEIPWQPAIAGLDPDSGTLTLRFAGLDVEELAADTRTLTEALRVWSAETGAQHGNVTMLGMTTHVGEQITNNNVDPFVLLDQVEQAVAMGTDRIGHGLILGVEPKVLVDKGLLTPERIEEFRTRQAALVDRVRERGIVIEANMSSNTEISNLTKDQHPAGIFVEKDLRVTANTDDETVLATDLQRELERVARAPGVEREDIAAMVLEGYRSRMGNRELANRTRFKAALRDALTTGLDEHDLDELVRHLSARFGVETRGSPAQTLSITLDAVLGVD